MKVTLELSLIPLGGEPHFSQPLARFLKHLQKEGIPFLLGPMGTTLEGEWEELFSAIARGCAALLEEYPRVYGVIKFDLGAEKSAREKVRSLEKLLNEPYEEKEE